MVLVLRMQMLMIYRFVFVQMSVVRPKFPVLIVGFGSFANTDYLARTPKKQSYEECWTIRITTSL
jgi:hypothetical protein